MSIIVNWLEHVFDPEEVVIIQRSDTRNGTFNILATIEHGTTSYIDTSALDNTVYFYKVLNTLNESTGSSIVIPLANFPNAGPGNTVPIRGDWEVGYFGEVDASLLPPYTDVRLKTGPPPYTNPLKWFKWIINGRIIYFANSYYQQNYSVTAMGKIFPAAGTDRVANGVIVSLNGFNYLARLPYVTNKFTTEINPFGEFITSSNGLLTNFDDTYAKSEMAALFATVFGLGSPQFNIPKCSDLVLSLPTGSPWIIAGNYKVANGPLAVSASANNNNVGGVWNMTTTTNTVTCVVFELQL